jgi:hypothetical protein
VLAAPAGVQSPVVPAYRRSGSPTWCATPAPGWLLCGRVAARRVPEVEAGGGDVEECAPRPPRSRTLRGAASRGAAYVIYTSGLPHGTPRGAVVVDARASPPRPLRSPRPLRGPDDRVLSRFLQLRPAWSRRSRRSPPGRAWCCAATSGAPRTPSPLGGEERITCSTSPPRSGLVLADDWAGPECAPAAEGCVLVIRRGERCSALRGALARAPARGAACLTPTAHEGGGSPPPRSTSPRASATGVGAQARTPVRGPSGERSAYVLTSA